MALSRGPGDEPDTEKPGDWSGDATVRKEDYFNRHLDGKQSPDDAQFEPDLKKLLKNLYERQRQEAYDLLERATGRLSSDGEELSVLKQHKQEFRDDYSKQCQGFAAERDRYISEFQKAREIREELERGSRRGTLEQGFDDRPKRTR